MRFFTNYGFYIAVCARPGDGGYGEPMNESRLMVRASLREHLATLKTRFPGVMREAGIQVFLGSDYALRIFVPPVAWVTVAAELAYGNFEEEVAPGAATQGYEAALHDVWSVMNRLQRRA